MQRASSSRSHRQPGVVPGASPAPASPHLLGLQGPVPRRRRTRLTTLLFPRQQQQQPPPPPRSSQEEKEEKEKEAEKEEEKPDVENGKEELIK